MYHDDCTFETGIPPTGANLSGCLEPKLYRSEESKNKVMTWACSSNNLVLIERAVLNGANVSVTEFGYMKYPWPGRYIRGYTLYAAVCNGHKEAFELLLELGAKVDELSIDDRLAQTIDNMESFPSGTWDFLPVCIDKGFDVKSRQRVGLPSLPALVHSGAPIELFEMLLDKGVDPNETHTTGRFKFSHALSQAIMQNQMPLMRLLLARGANIHGTDLWQPQEDALHIPVMAAAQAMVRHGFGPMQFCLDNGADINQQAWVFLYGYPLYKASKNSRLHDNSHYFSTPLLTYIDSIISWGETGPVHPVDAIQFLLDNGADLYNDTEPLEGIKEGPCSLSALRKLKPAPTCIDVLFDKWGLQKLAVPTFFETVKFLVSCETSCERLARVLSRCEYNCNLKSGHPDGDAERFIAAWKRLLTTACENEALNPNELLAYYISHEGRQICNKDNQSLARLTVDHLQAEGSLNARIESGGATGLHLLCRQYAQSADIYSSGARGRKIKAFLRFLLERGMNPSVPLGHETAIDILLDIKEPYSERSEKLLLEIARLLDRYELLFPAR